MTLNIERDGGQSGGQPDLSALRGDFDVLGTSTGSQMNIINGSVSSLTRWSVQLQPRRTGTLEIPPIAVGQEHTAALELHVTAPSPLAVNHGAGPAFVEIESANPGKSIYVQQQIPYTVRLYYDETVQNGELGAPEPANAVVEQLGEEKRYAVTRHGRQFSVIERHYVIAPEKNGSLVIPGVAFRGTAVNSQGPQDAGGAPDDLMDRFLRGTPFSSVPFPQGGLRMGTLFGDAGHPIATRGQDVMLQVQPRPAAARGNWLPAEQITLHDSWQDNPPQLKVGEPATRTILIEAKGLAASQIPPLNLAQPGNARLYPEAADNKSRTDGDAIYGISKQSVTYIPNAQGTLVVPPVELAWWNVRSDAQSLVTLPAREFAIAPGAAGSQSNATPPPVTAPLSANAQHPMQAASLTRAPQNRWAWLAGGLALLAAVLSVVAYRARRRGSRAVPSPETSAALPRRRAVLRALHQACSGDDRHAAADALMDLARIEWTTKPPRGLRELAARLDAGHAEIIALDRSLYGAGGPDWKGGELWNALQRGFQPKGKQSAREDDGLEALYL